MISVAAPLPDVERLCLRRPALVVFPRWTVRLASVEQRERDGGDEGEDFFDVTFELSGLGVSGSLSALVTDPPHLRARLDQRRKAHTLRTRFRCDPQAYLQVLEHKAIQLIVPA